MGKYKLFAIMVLTLASVAATAKSLNWEFAVEDQESQAFVSVGVVELKGALRAVDFLRNYSEKINLGIDPITNAEWYPHQSVTINYEVDCGERTLAMRAWKMYEKPNAKGETIWVDKNHGLPNFVLARSGEELAVVDAACSETVVLSPQSVPSKSQL